MNLDVFIVLTSNDLLNMYDLTEQILTDTARVMSQERSVINGATAMFVSPVVDFYQSMSPFLLLALVLIVADTRFGVAAARKRGSAYAPLGNGGGL